MFKKRVMKHVVHLNAVDGLEYGLLEFTTINHRLKRPVINVKVFINSKIDNSMTKCEEYFDLNADSLGYYDRLAKERLNMAINSSQEYNLLVFKHAKEKMSALFDVMSSLTGYEWYY